MPRDNSHFAAGATKCLKATEYILGNSVAGTNLVHLYFLLHSSYKSILCDRYIKLYLPITTAVLFHHLQLCQMQHAAQAHLHLPDALLSFWRADVLTSHASTSSALFYCFTETWLQREVPLVCDTATGSVLHTAAHTDAALKLLQFVTILLQHIHSTLVLQLYLGLLLQYSGLFICSLVR